MRSSRLLPGPAALLVLFAGAGCVGAPGAGSGPTVAGEAPPTNVWEGVFSIEQAQRGTSAYVRDCSACHAADLRGSGNAPSLVGASFLFLWEGRSVDELFTAIRTDMPTNAPNSLAPETYLEIVAYILARNDFPPGRRELTADPSYMGGIAITSTGVR